MEAFPFTIFILENPAKPDCFSLTTLKLSVDCTKECVIEPKPMECLCLPRVVGQGRATSLSAHWKVGKVLLGHGEGDEHPKKNILGSNKIHPPRSLRIKQNIIRIQTNIQKDQEKILLGSKKYSPL